MGNIPPFPLKRYDTSRIIRRIFANINPVKPNVPSKGHLNNFNKNRNKTSYTETNIFLDKDDLGKHVGIKIQFSSDRQVEQQILCG
jgi:hypothetical protein